MKRYTHYRLGLLIGWLSLHTLSACVHTKKELGYRPNCNVKSATVCKAVTVISLLAPVIYYFYHFGIEEEGFKEWWGTNDRETNDHRMSCLTIGRPSSWNTTAMPYVNATQADSIIHAIQSAQVKFATDGKAEDGVTLLDPMVLDDQIINDIKSHHFSPKIIACWLGQGLNIEAKDPNQALIDKRHTTGWTLLMYAVWRRDTPAVQFLLAQGANVNTQNHAGETSLMIALERNSNDIIDLLIENKADPCIKNKYGETALSLAKRNAKYSSWTATIAKLDKSVEKLHKTKQCHLTA